MGLGAGAGWGGHCACPAALPRLLPPCICLCLGSLAMCRRPRAQGATGGLLVGRLESGISSSRAGAGAFLHAAWCPRAFRGSEMFHRGSSIACQGDREQSDEEGWEQKLGVRGEGPRWRPEEEEGVFME